MNLYTWALKHGVSLAALTELDAMFGLHPAGLEEGEIGRSEAAVQQAVLSEAARKGLRLFRNNVGAGRLEGGSFIRFGLANSSKGVNAIIKSGDLIGIRPVLITPEHVGQTIGQFVSREVKASDWRYSGNEREVAQLAWAQLIVSYGGDAAFCNSEGSL